MAELLLQKSNPPEALPHLEQLRKQYPDRADVMARMGHCRFLEGKTAEARQLLEAAVERMPNDSIVLLHLAKLDMGDNRWAQAEAWLLRALEGRPVRLPGSIRAGHLSRGSGSGEGSSRDAQQSQKTRAALDRANHLLEEMAVHSSGDAGAACEVGVALLHVGQDRLALYWLDQAAAA